MDTLHIHGNHPLNGHIPISGAKNSALKLMAAALLTDEPVSLRHIPILDDTRFMAQLLGELGVDVKWTPNKICTLHAQNLTSTTAPYRLVHKMRATFNVLGPLLAREGQAHVSLPGGCAIGARPVNLHLAAFAAMGADISIEDGYVHARAESGLCGAQIDFDCVSVGATEHVMLAASLAKGRTILTNAACEPEIIDLATCLSAMGARICGAGTSCITIDGVEHLYGADHAVMPDRIEAGAYAIAATATGGDVVLEGVCAAHMQALIELLRQTGTDIDIDGHSNEISRIRVHRARPLHAVESVQTAPYPGFPTDLQAPFMALMTLATGTSRITETIFENRFMHAPELCRLGANIDVQGNCAQVQGVPALRGAEVVATDLRASISLVVAGLAAHGPSIIRRLDHLDRGFECLEQKLSACGADLTRLSWPDDAQHEINPPARGAAAA